MPKSNSFHIIDFTHCAYVCVDYIIYRTLHFESKETQLPDGAVYEKRVVKFIYVQTFSLELMNEVRNWQR